MIKHLIICLGLGGLQGGIGWFMVASGFSDLMDVSPIRLSLHLGIALLIYAWLLSLWIGLKLNQPIKTYSGTVGISGLIALLIITLFSGALVAGTNGGFIYNTFPMMGTHWWPPEYDPTLWLYNPATAQAHHRVIAIILAVLTLIWGGVHYSNASRLQKNAIVFLMITIIAQVILGILTLLWIVPISLAVLHQGVAILALSLFFYNYQLFIRKI